MINADAEILKQFSHELASLYDSKPPVSKAKMMQLTKVALKGLKFYKHVVMAVEKFIHRCKAEYKLPGLYVIDSIVRQSKHQFGVDKDVFAPRFCKNLPSTLQAASACVEEDKPKVVRILNLWLQNKVFTEQHLKTAINRMTNNESDSADEKESDTAADLEETKIQPEPSQPKKTTPSTDKTATAASPAQNSQTEELKKLMEPALLHQIQKLTSTLISQQKKSTDSERKLTKRILADYEYSDDEASGDETSERDLTAMLTDADERQSLSANLATAAQSLLNNPQILHQLQKMQNAASVSSAPTVSPPPAPVAPPITSVVPAPSFHHAPPPQQQQRSAVKLSTEYPNIAHHPPPVVDFSVPPPRPPTGGAPFAPFDATTFDAQTCNYAPPAEPLPPGFDASAASRKEDRDERRQVQQQHDDDYRRRKRNRSRSKSLDKKQRKHRRSSRSRSKSRSRSSAKQRHHRSSRSKSKSPPRTTKEHRERERHRKNRGMLPNPKARHATIYSCTLWFGRVPALCTPEEIKEALKDFGQPISIDIIPPRGCAYVVMSDRKAAFKVLDKSKDLKVQNRSLKMAWAQGKGVKDVYDDFWDADHGATHIPWDRLPPNNEHDSFVRLTDGGWPDVESLPENVKKLFEERSLTAVEGAKVSAAASAPAAAAPTPVVQNIPVLQQPPTAPMLFQPPFGAPGAPLMYPPPFGIPPPVMFDPRVTSAMSANMPMPVPNAQFMAGQRPPSFGTSPRAPLVAPPLPPSSFMMALGGANGVSRIPLPPPSFLPPPPAATAPVTHFGGTPMVPAPFDRRRAAAPQRRDEPWQRDRWRPSLPAVRHLPPSLYDDDDDLAGDSAAVAMSTPIAGGPRRFIGLQQHTPLRNTRREFERPVRADHVAEAAAWPQPWQPVEQSPPKVLDLQDERGGRGEDYRDHDNDQVLQAELQTVHQEMAAPSDTAGEEPQVAKDASSEQLSTTQPFEDSSRHFDSNQEMQFEKNATEAVVAPDREDDNKRPTSEAQAEPHPATLISSTSDQPSEFGGQTAPWTATVVQDEAVDESYGFEVQPTAQHEQDVAAVEKHEQLQQQVETAVPDVTTNLIEQGTSETVENP